MVSCVCQVVAIVNSSAERFIFMGLEVNRKNVGFILPNGILTLFKNIPKNLDKNMSITGPVFNMSA